MAPHDGDEWGPGMSLTLEEFSDRELLFAFEEHADGDGTISSHELADGLGLRPSDNGNGGLKHPHQNIAVRLTWLKRYGVLYRDPQTKRWAMTEVGARMMHGKLRAAERRIVGDVDEDRLYAVMSEIGRSVLTAHDEAATMVARHWRYTMAERKRSRNGRR